MVNIKLLQYKAALFEKMAMELEDSDIPNVDHSESDDSTGENKSLNQE